MSVNHQFRENFRGAVDQNFAAQAEKPKPMQVAMDFQNGWVSDVKTQQVYLPSSATNVGGQTVVTGAKGYNKDGAYGLSPIIKP